MKDSISIAKDELTYPDYWAVTLGKKTPGGYVVGYLMKSQGIWVFIKGDGKSPQYSITGIVYKLNKLDCLRSFIVCLFLLKIKWTCSEKSRYYLINIHDYNRQTYFQKALY